MKGYLVVGSTGDDYCKYDWYLKVFLNERSAQKLIINLTKNLNKALKGKDSYETFEEFEFIEEFMQQYDPKFRIDYTGVKYFIEEVEVEINV